MSQSLIKIKEYNEDHVVISYLPTSSDDNRVSQMVVLKGDLRDLGEWLVVLANEEDL